MNFGILKSNKKKPKVAAHRRMRLESLEKRYLLASDFSVGVISNPIINEGGSTSVVITVLTDGPPGNSGQSLQFFASEDPGAQASFPSSFSINWSVGATYTVNITAIDDAIPELSDLVFVSFTANGEREGIAFTINASDTADHHPEVCLSVVDGTMGEVDPLTGNPLNQATIQIEVQNNPYYREGESIPFSFEIVGNSIFSYDASIEVGGAVEWYEGAVYTFTVSTTDDIFDEGTETANITLVPGGDTVVTCSSGSVSILDNDQGSGVYEDDDDSGLPADHPQISLNVIRSVAAEDGTATALLEVSVVNDPASGSSAGTSVNWSIAQFSGTASYNDYTASPLAGSLPWFLGSKVTIPVIAVNDALVEGMEYANFKLTSSNASVLYGYGAVSIRDNDEWIRPRITLRVAGDGSTAVEGGRDGKLFVEVLNNPPSPSAFQNISFSIDATQFPADYPGDYTFAVSTLSLPWRKGAAAEVTVDAIADGTVDPNEVATLRLNAATTIDIVQSIGTVTILEPANPNPDYSVDYPIRCTCVCTCSSDPGASTDEQTGDPLVPEPNTSRTLAPRTNNFSETLSLPSPPQGSGGSPLSRSSLKVSGTINGTPIQDLHYSAASFGSSGTAHVNFDLYEAVDPESNSQVGLPGSKPYSFTYTEKFSDNSTRTFNRSGRVIVRPKSSETFGLGWLNTEEKTLKPTSGGLDLFDGHGNVWFFRAAGGEFIGPENYPGGGGVITPDGNGFTWNTGTDDEYLFDSSGNILEHRDPAGQITNYSYSVLSDNTSKRLTSITRPGNRQTFYEYGSQGRLSRIRHADGLRTSFTYSAGLLQSVTETDPDGSGAQTSRITTYLYQPSGRLSQIQYADGSSESFSYNARGGVQTHTNREGLVKSLSSVWDHAYVSLSNGEGDQSSPATLLNGAPSMTISDSSGRTTSKTVNRFGSPTSTVDAEGQTTDVEYDKENNPVEVTVSDSAGIRSQITHQYDLLDRVVRTTMLNGGQWTYTYDTSYRTPSTITDPLGRVTKNVVDPQTGLLLSTRGVVGLDDTLSTETDDRVETFTYTTVASNSPPGLLDTYVDPMGVLTDLNYDSRGNLIEFKSAVGTAALSTQTFQYEAGDRLTLSVNPLGFPTQYVYDQAGRLRETILANDAGVIGALSPVYKLDYDTIGRVVKQTDPLGNQTTFQYNSGSNLTQIRRLNAQSQPQATWTQAFDSAGRRISVTDPINRVTSFGYDDVDRVVSITHPDPDGNGSLSSPVELFSYDALDRLLTSNDGFGRITSFAYDDLLNKVSRTDPDPDASGPLAAVTTIMTYNDSGDLESVDTPQGRTQYLYDPLAQLIRIVKPSPGTDDHGAVGRNFAYDLAGRLIEVSNPAGLPDRYFYDELGRMIRHDGPDPDGISPSLPELPSRELFEYDDAGQLISTTDASGLVTQYQYDPRGNQVLSTKLEFATSGFVPWTVTSWTYDAADRLKTRTSSLRGTETYNYDAMDRLTSILHADPDGPTQPLVSATSSFT
jgi:YD repeat-containing protein